MRAANTIIDPPTRRTRAPRTRRHLGVAVVAALTGGLAVGAVHRAQADIGTGDRPVFVPVVPCRLFDTRVADAVGPRTAPLGQGDVHTQTVRGTNGNCSIPTDAVGIAMNVTIANPTANAFLTIWPADAARPLASNLNWGAGDAPDPNKVDVKLSSDGKINVFNSGGSVDVIADVVGYYASHHHDDRYYSRAEVDASLATKLDKSAAPTAVHVNALSFVPLLAAPINHTLVGSVFGGAGSSSGTCAGSAVTLPHGSTVTQLTARLYDNSSAQVLFALQRDPLGAPTASTMADGNTGAAASTPGEVTITDTSIASATVDTTTSVYNVLVCGLTINSGLYDVTVTLAPPA